MSCLAHHLDSPHPLASAQSGQAVVDLKGGAHEPECMCMGSAGLTGAQTQPLAFGWVIIWAQIHEGAMGLESGNPGFEASCGHVVSDCNL